MDIQQPPFVLLDDARPAHVGERRSFFCAHPEEIICANKMPEIQPALDRLDQAIASGATVSGWISYEVAGIFEPRLAGLLDKPSSLPFLWLMVTYKEDRVTASDHPFTNHNAGTLRIAEPPGTTRWFEKAFSAVKSFINDGDCYQINLTFPLDITYEGDLAALFNSLKASQPAPYCSLIHTGEAALLSLSPEQFIRNVGGQLEALPMKGTAQRGLDATHDNRIKEQLQKDEKSRAENLMIVDLLRNDISRVAHPGSVRVPKLFHIESYPTVHQMISSVQAKAVDGLKPSQLLKALFPCGSVTGAPKIRAMQIIDTLEQGPRGPYCGSIVRFKGMDNQADWSLSVPIRTLVFDTICSKTGAHEGTLHVGAGLVADSDCATELAECRLKAEFAKPTEMSPMVAGTLPPNLIESMKLIITAEAGVTIPLLDDHLNRLTRSAAYLGYRVDGPDLRQRIQDWLTTKTWQPGAYKCRIEVAPDGRLVDIGANEMPPAPANTCLRLALCDHPLRADDQWLYHKTTNRLIYNRALAAAKESGLDDLIFMNREGFVTETSIYSIFLAGDDGLYRTPPLQHGLLPGVQRGAMLNSHKAVEQPIGVDDLVSAGTFMVGNSVRGMIPANLVFDDKGNPLMLALGR